MIQYNLVYMFNMLGAHKVVLCYKKLSNMNRISLETFSHLHASQYSYSNSASWLDNLQFHARNISFVTTRREEILCSTRLSMSRPPPRPAFSTWWDLKRFCRSQPVTEQRLKGRKMFAISHSLSSSVVDVDGAGCWTYERKEKLWAQAGYGQRMAVEKSFSSVNKSD